MSGPNWKLEDNYKILTLSFPSTPPVSLKMDVRGIEDFLKYLGEFRYAMKPEIPKTFARGQKVSAIPDPAWVTEPDAMRGDSILHIRDPRYGWLHYVLPRKEAKKLAGLLQNQAELPPVKPTLNKVN
jgi:hypothetical protein